MSIYEQVLNEWVSSYNAVARLKSRPTISLNINTSLGIDDRGSFIASKVSCIASGHAPFLVYQRGLDSREESCKELVMMLMSSGLINQPSFNETLE